MPTTYPITIKEKIISDLETHLSRIKKVGGYDNDIQLVERWKQRGNDKASLPAIFVHSGTEEKENRPSLITHNVLNIFLDCWAMHDTTEFTKSTDEYLNSLAYDIEKAVMVDEQRCNLAERTTVVTVEPFETVDGQPFCGVILQLEIAYKHKRGDPKTQL